MKQAPFADTEFIDTDTGDPMADLPPSLRDWVMQNGLDPDDQGATVSLKCLQGELKGMIGKWTASEAMEELDFEEVGRKYGPGRYQWLFSSKKGSKSKTITLSPARYGPMHREYRRMQQEYSNPAPTASGNSDAAQIVEKQLEGTMRMLSTMQGMMPQPVQPPAPVDNTPVLMQMMQNQMQMALESSKQQMTMMMGMFQTLGTMMTASMNRPEPPRENPMNNVTALLDVASRIAEIKSPALPPEKETMAERIVGMVGDMLPTVLEVLTKKAEGRPLSVMQRIGYDRVLANPDIQAAQNDPELRMMVAEKMAAEHGLERTRELAEKLGWADVVQAIDQELQKRLEPVSEPAEAEVADENRGED